MAKFQLPQNGEVFMSEVFLRCEGLIELGIWNGISKTRFLQWLTNFRDALEQYFAACVLDNLIYRSEAQTLALIEHLFQRVLPDLAHAQGWTHLLRKQWTKILASSSLDPDIRLVAVAKQSDPPHKSSSAILRLMKRRYRIDDKWTVAAWNLPKSGITSNTIVLFIDDFLGTGDQFEKFYAAEGLSTLLANQRKAYLPLAGYSEGCDNLQVKITGLSVQPVELLSNKHRLFHAESECFTDNTNTADGAETFYYELLASRGIDLIGDDRRGFGGLELAYAFQHAAPDNCLPIFWWRDSPQWIPLFDR